MTSISASDWAELEARMRRDATESLTLDELLQHAHCWLYEHRILISAERKLRDICRAIWSDVERGLLARIEPTVTQAQLVHADAVLSSQHGISGIRVLEWLKTPPARHSPTTLTETLEKVRALKELGAHTWELDAVPIAKQHAYAQRIQARRPAKVLELNSLATELIFLCYYLTKSVTTCYCFKNQVATSNLWSALTFMPQKGRLD